MVAVQPSPVSGINYVQYDLRDAGLTEAPHLLQTVSATSSSNANSSTASGGHAPLATPVGNGNGTNSTSGHNGTAFATALPVPTSFAPPSPPSRPVTSHLGVGLGIALGFAAVVILIVLWHIVKGARQRRLQARHGEYSAEVGEQRPTEASSSSSSTVLPSPGKGKQTAAHAMAAGVVETDTTDASQDETRPPEMREIAGNQDQSPPRPGRGRGRGRVRGRERGQTRLTASLWERKYGRKQTADGETPGAGEMADGERRKFSFEETEQVGDSIEAIESASPARGVVLTDKRTAVDGGRGTKGDKKDEKEKKEKEKEAEEGTGKTVHFDQEKGETARHVYEMDPH